MEPAPPLVLFDIDGTLVRKAGPHHREALMTAVRHVTGLRTTTDDVPVAGALDRDILKTMMRRAGLKTPAILAAMPAIVEHAQLVYAETCPALTRRVCPGAKAALTKIQKHGAVMVLVTGNLSEIGWRKLEQAGLKDFFRFGAFAEMATTRAGLAKIAIREARARKWIRRGSQISLIGDHPNDVKAARTNRIRSIAVATGPATFEELANHSPDLILPDLRAFDLEMLL